MSKINAQNFGDGTDSVPASAVIEGTAKAWTHFDATAVTVTSSDSYNESSITDNGGGDFTVNFNNSFASVNYVTHGACGSGSVASSVIPGIRLGVLSVSDIRFTTIYASASSSSAANYADTAVSFMGDLA